MPYINKKHRHFKRFTVLVEKYEFLHRYGHTMKNGERNQKLPTMEHFGW